VPARIVIVHDDPEFAEEVASALKRVGYDAVAFTDSMKALEALDDPKKIELLITRVRFQPGKPNGVSLARMARQKRPRIKILFTALPEFAELVDGLGEFMPLPIELPALMAAVERLLAPSP
jgi:DNA-binding NtrC family response regulator